MRQPILIARPETEEWATRIAQHLNTFAFHQHQPLRILDIGTGSGCIPLLLSSEVDKSGVDLSFVGIDCSAKAIDLAHENKLLHGSLLRHPVDFMQADLFNDQRMGTLGKFDIILSNPPYISSLDYATLDASVREWEDVAALVPFTTWNTSDGLECYRRIVHLLPTLLRSDARPGMMRVGLEIGHLQAEAVVRLLELHAVGQVQKTEVWKDAFGQDRVVAGWSKSV